MAYAPAVAALHVLADGNKEAEPILAQLEAGKLYDRAYRDAVDHFLEVVCPIYGSLEGDQLQINRVHRSWLVSAIAFAVPEGHA